VQYQYIGMMSFGLTVDQNITLCCGPGAIRTNFKIDNRITYPNTPNIGAPLPLDRFGKARKGIQSMFTDGPSKLQITQQLEVVPSKPAAGKRHLDVVLVRYLIENKDTRAHDFGLRVRIDTMCNNNDGALFAAPQTHPGKVLDGIELKGKDLPDFVQILERPNLKDPGFVGHFTLKLPGSRIGPDRFVCTCHRIGDNGWDTPAMQAQGDSDCALFWSPRSIAPGQKVEFSYAYGKGIASLPESEGRLKVALDGNFEPGKLFTVEATVSEPVPGQTLDLELPAGMTLVEGSAIQPVAAVGDDAANGMALWRGRVDRVGDFTFRIRSSNGIVETRTVSVAR
jgi:hypothetical protein